MCFFLNIFNINDKMINLTINQDNFNNMDYLKILFLKKNNDVRIYVHILSSFQ